MDQKKPPSPHIPQNEPELHAHYAALQTAGEARDEDMDLAGAALALALLDCRDQSAAPYHEHLAAIASAVGGACAAAEDIGARAAALAMVISGQFGYAGDQENYHDMQNANLIRVIDRRRGLPVALGILYILAARAQGWDCAGLNFPGHFLIRLELGPARRILDPFNGGGVVEIAQLRRLLKDVAGDGAELRPEHYQPISDRDVLLRLLNNIKGRALQADDLPRAAGILLRMRLVSPGTAYLCYEHGAVHARLGNVPEAVEAMAACAEQAEDARLRQYAEQALKQLRLRMN